MLSLRLRRPATFLLLHSLALVLCLQPAARAQGKGQASAQQVFCDPPRALALVRMQLSESKAFTDPVKRISVMTRAADLLWADERETARAVFTEAFDLASAHFREHGDEVRHEQARADSKMSGLTVEVPDQRFVVLRAIARHDAVWARELAARAADETRAEESKNKEAAAGSNRRPVGAKLLSFAETLLPNDLQTALAVARTTFRDPATMYLPHFLFEVAKVDRAAADALYREAFAAYAGRDTDSLIYLSQYPFALEYPVVQELGYMYSAPPRGFTGDPELQRQYVAAYLSLAERRLAALAQQPPTPDETSGHHSEPDTIYEALRALESLSGPQQPATLERITALEGQAVVLLSPERQRAIASEAARASSPPESAGGGGDPFDNMIEQAGRQADPGRRDHSITVAIVAVGALAPVDKVEDAAQKIGDMETRGQVLNWFYFMRAQAAVKGGALDDARKLAEHVEALDERALLFLQIAEEGLKRAGDRVRAAELLNAVVAAADKAPETEAKARTLLGVAYLYSKLDQLRALEVMGLAVKTINRLRDPNLGSAYLMRRIQGRDFAMYMSHPMPGFSLENSFRELGARDFEATISAANNLDDKYLRAVGVLAVAARCLEDAQKPATRKPARPTPAPKNQDAPKKTDAPKKPATQTSLKTSPKQSAPALS